MEKKKETWKLELLLQDEPYLMLDGEEIYLLTISSVLNEILVSEDSLSFVETDVLLVCKVLPLHHLQDFCKRCLKWTGLTRTIRKLKWLS